MKQQKKLNIYLSESAAGIIIETGETVSDIFFE